MAKDYAEIKKNALSSILEDMCIAARTAPKTRGRDQLVIMIAEAEDKKMLTGRMRELSESSGRESLARDASNLDGIDHILLVGVKNAPMGLDCGFCGHPTCKDLASSGGVCSYNSMDLGIALGSAVSLAARAHVDNRLMYSIGKAALELGLMGEGVAQAIGVPLSATGKNPFFDRSK